MNDKTHGALVVQHGEAHNISHNGFLSGNWDGRKWATYTSLYQIELRHLAGKMLARPAATTKYWMVDFPSKPALY